MRLDQRLTQKLALTPQMRQSLEMLQMNVLELQQQVLQELAENPLLEEVSDLDSPQSDDETPLNEPERDPLDEVMSLLLKRQGDYPGEDDEPRSQVTERWRGDSEIADPAVYERVLSSRENLADHLIGQLNLTRLSEADSDVAKRIIGNIDDDGLLRTPLGEIASNAGVNLPKAKQILRLVQEFDPPGVGARDLKECLKLQLRSLFAEHEIFANSEPLTPKLHDIANAAIEHHFDLLVAHKHAELKKALRISDVTLKKMLQVIEALEPRPGRVFEGDKGTPIVPDVYVVKRRNEYVPILNEQKIPKLRVVKNYQNNFSIDQLGEEELKFIQQRAVRAQWIMRNISQWKTTMLRVAKIIVKFESEFFEKGALFMKPLRLGDVAKELELHETTVGRTVTNKFIDTPRGLFEMKYFFHRGLGTLGGTRISSITIKHLIAELIESEPRDAPYNDQRIADILEERRIKVSRRAVAKYRESQGIPPSHARKRSHTK